MHTNPFDIGDDQRKPRCMAIDWVEGKVQKALLSLQSANDPETLWQASYLAARAVVSEYNDVLFASPFLGTYPVFGRTASGYPRGEAYWGRLGEIAGASDVMMAMPDLKVARMSDHFDISREKDCLMFEEFMKPEGWRFCLNTFFRSAQGMPLGTLAVNRTEAQGDFSDEDLEAFAQMHPHIEAALIRIFEAQNARSKDLALESCLYALPVPFLVLDWNYNITFANLSGREALHIWRTGPVAARASNPVIELSSDLLEATTKVRTSWENAVREDNYESFGKPLVVANSRNPEMRATLRPVLPADGAAFELGLIIQFKVPTSVHSEAAQAMSAIGLLTATEREISRMVATGHDNQDIATCLGISIHTVRAHLRAVFRKLGINSRARLAPLHATLLTTNAELLTEDQHANAPTVKSAPAPNRPLQEQI